MDNVLEDHPAFESMSKKLAELDILWRDEDLKNDTLIQ
jgi:hypothetical protein